MKWTWKWLRFKKMKKLMKNNIVPELLKIISIFMAFPLLAFAQYPDAVQVLIDDGLNVEAGFDAPGGLKGYVGRKDGHAVTLYLMADGEHVVVGKMVDDFGQDLSAEHIRAWLPETDLTRAWQQLENATWIAEGPEDAKRIVYAFTDPNCGYCIELRRKASAYLNTGIQLRHIMVGVIYPSSFAKAASVIGADNPVKYLAFLEAQPPNSWREPPGKISDELKDKIDANNELMKALAVSATPSVFYRNAEGEVKKIVGLPDDTALSNAVFRPPS
ncbi:MAG: thiol:disulfide interchange protein DsbG [Marinobacter sp.]|nr:thiol:disulfide interchange protein DsbG [Marinobacter sp.]